MPNWTVYKSEREGFPACFPGNVKRQFLGFWADDGSSPASIVHTCETERGHLYEVRLTRMSYVRSAEDFLQTVLREMAGTIRGVTQVEQKPSSFQRLPSVNFEMGIRNSHIFSGIAVLSGNTVYIASALAPTGSPDP
jgi:hypothetical protein